MKRNKYSTNLVSNTGDICVNMRRCGGRAAAARLVVVWQG
jgi:hypothetical protein